MHQNQKIPEPQINFQLILNKKGYNNNLKLVDQNTYIGCKWQNDNCCFKYVSFDGEILAELQQPVCNLRDWIVVSEQEAVILEYDRKYCYLGLWNFRDKKYSRIVVKVLENDSQKGIFYFKNSHMVCFYSKCQQQQIQLIYYKLAEFSNGNIFHEHICAEFSFRNQTEISSKIIKKRSIVKLNDKSMVGFITQQFSLSEGSYFLSYYDLDGEKRTGELKKFQLKIHQKLNPHNFDYMRAKVTDIWEAAENLFYLQIYTSADIYKFQKSATKAKFENQCQRYHCLYYNCQENTLKFGKINIAEDHRLQFINVPRALKYKQREKWPLFKRLTESWSCPDMPEEPKVIGVPIYYIEPDGQKILMSNHAISKIWEEQLEWPNYISDKMYKIVVKSVHHQEVTVYKFPEEWFPYLCGLKLLSVKLMNELVQHCDDDLVEYVHNLL